MFELQVLSFIFISLCRRCPLCLKLTSFVLYVFKSYTFCPLGLTQLVFSVKFGHVLCTRGHFCQFIFTGTNCVDNKNSQHFLKIKKYFKKSFSK
ncbi:hypothetical protein HanRHA438_Chr03g0106791 [Helianthus annuus]|nr:hypothetical protein HanRHA438_Chr03g0106791 [Helianthus annuus]